MAHLLEAISKFSLEAVLGMLLIVVGERAEIIPVAKVDLSRQPLSPYDQIPLNPLHLGLDVFDRPFFAFKLRFQFRYDLRNLLFSSFGLCALVRLFKSRSHFVIFVAVVAALTWTFALVL